MPFDHILRYLFDASPDWAKHWAANVIGFLLVAVVIIGGVNFLLDLLLKVRSKLTRFVSVRRRTP